MYAQTVTSCVLTRSLRTYFIAQESLTLSGSQWRTEGGGFGGFKPPEIQKTLQNRVKRNPIVKTVKSCLM